MEKFHQKIMNTNFTKKLKQWVILAICVVVLGGGLSVVMLREQITELFTYTDEWHQELRQDRHADRNYDGDDFNRAEQDMQRYESKDMFAEDIYMPDIEITEPSIPAKVTVSITGVLCGLVWLSFWLLIAAWLYQAATLSGMNGLLWLVLGLIGNIPAAVVFLVIRSFTRKKCSVCGKYQPAKTHYCTHCGAAFNKKCPDCGAICSNKENFCHSCGKELN